MRARRRPPPPSQPINLGQHSGPLRLVAFSDYRIQDIQLLIEDLSKLQPRPDLILYAGDDVARFRPSSGENLFEAIASCARYGLCAVAGNDDEPTLRTLISGRSVFNVHLSPMVLGRYAVLGIDGAPRRRGIGIGPNLHPEKQIASHLAAQMRATMATKVIILSHAPPEGILDEAERFSEEPQSIGSRALNGFMRSHKSVGLVVCGHVHRCGGKHKKVGRALVLNAANHDDDKAVNRFAVLKLQSSGRCEIEWREMRETRVVPEIGPPSGGRLRKVGIRTVEELAAAPLELLRCIPHLGACPEVLKARAQAMVENKPILLRPVELPTGPELFLDIETDLRQEYVWLIGLSVGRSGDYTNFFAQTPAEEKDTLVQFVDFSARYPEATLLSLSGSEFDLRVIRKRLTHYGLGTEVCERIVDLYWTLQMTVALPTSSYRVKEVGQFFGYRYRHPDLDGFRVASLYENRYQQLRNTAARRKLASRLIEYNEDDVRCLPHILNRIQALATQPAQEQ